MSETTMRKHQTLPPPVPPPLDFDVYRKVLHNQPPAVQTEEQIKHVGWQVIEATNHQSQSPGNQLKERGLSILERTKGLPGRARVLIDKFTPFQILGGILIITAALLLVAAKNQVWFILAVSGAAQITIDIVLKKRSTVSS